jgi:hypothetical protein
MIEEEMQSLVFWCDCKLGPRVMAGFLLELVNLSLL